MSTLYYFTQSLGKSRKMSEDDNLDVMRELLLQSMIKKGSRGKDSIVQVKGP